MSVEERSNALSTFAPVKDSIFCSSLVRLTVSVSSHTHRLAKEVSYYEKEVKENEAKLAKMKEDKADSYDIKKFEEVLGESYMMIPDSKARFEKSLEELSLFLDTNTLEEGEWVSTAQSILKENGVSSGTTGEAGTNLDDLKEGEAF